MCSRRQRGSSVALSVRLYKLLFTISVHIISLYIPDILNYEYSTPRKKKRKMIMLVKYSMSMFKLKAFTHDSRITISRTSPDAFERAHTSTHFHIPRLPDNISCFIFICFIIKCVNIRIVCAYTVSMLCLLNVWIG